MGRELVIGGFYKHFKNKLYQAKCIAYHSETKEPMVVYQALYGDFSVYVRPLDMFLSEVDHVKYPDVKQVYRFEEVDISTMSQICSTPEEAVVTEEPEQVNEDLQANALNLFLDARGYEEKLDVLLKNKRFYNDAMLDVMAESLEVVVPEGTIESRIDSLKKVLLAHTKYEGSHLRP